MRRRVECSAVATHCDPSVRPLSADIKEVGASKG